ncbi:MAG TPA: hypothetical protein VEO91_04690 [Candidatus Limnocylindria bacterium]|nr:hypothetical protein [Candidatus Limnocylindria bacterium]
MTPIQPFIPARRARRPATIMAVVLALGMAACGPATGTPAASLPAAAGPSASVASSGSPAVTSSPSQTARPSPTATAGLPTAGLPGTTQTEWGVIWDDLPSRFPRKLGSEPTETGAGPASAILIVPATTQETAAWYAAALSAAGYRIEGTSGPYEDGGYVIDATGTAPGCRVQVTLARQGTATIATIYFGASCPFR